VRERVLLFGEVSARPEGLERSLVRAGFALAEGSAVEVPATPDLALIAVQRGGDLEAALARFADASWAGVPVVVLLATAERDGIARALSLGAADALAAPVDLPELCARLEARLRVRAEVQRAGGAGALQSELFQAIEEVAAAQRPEEMLETLVRRLGDAVGASHCACLLPSADRRHARLAAVHDNPTLRNVAVDLFHYPEAVEASVSGRTVYAPEVLQHRLFLTHLAQWPDSPEVHEIESSAAVPLITHRAVRAVVVIRTRRGEPILTREQVGHVERLVNATAALLEREDRRAGATRRQASAAAIDPLTGCATLDAFDRRLREEVERVRRYGSVLALALIDVDALRDLNARLGTAAGDRFLAELGGILHQELRSPDFVARYGGDEFALLMPSTGVDGARRLLARVAARIEAHPWTELSPTERPRLAAGLVTFPHPGVVRVEDLLAVAEGALVRGKAGDTDRIAHAAA
jgi:diguanylate cyclase (GGDEF)-like protein